MMMMTMRTMAVGLVLAAMLAGGGCTTEKTSDKQLRFVTAAQAQEMVGPRKKALGLGGKSTGVFVDARSEADFKAGHIPGAISLPYERVGEDHKILKSYDPVIIYGKEYNDARALGMSKRLIELKYGNIHTLTGGINEWKDAGNELATEAAAAGAATAEGEATKP